MSAEPAAAGRPPSPPRSGQQVSSAGAPSWDDAANREAAFAYARLRQRDKLAGVLAAAPAVAGLRDQDGATLLHLVAEHAEGCEELLAQPAADCMAVDGRGDTPLHVAAGAGCPMAAYALAKACPRACLAPNRAQRTPADIAKELGYGEVLNAMLLACCSAEASPGDSCPEALQAIAALLEAGAVPDTWAPNGNSALMMAASADSPRAVGLLLQQGAQINMKDTLGRTALMFAAGNDARSALVALMDAGGQEALSLQDNRGNNVLKYAQAEATKRLVEQRFAELEAAATANEAALLADLEAEEASAAAAAGAKQKRAHRGKKKRKGEKGGRGAAAAAAVPAAGAEQLLEQPAEAAAAAEPSGAGEAAGAADGSRCLPEAADAAGQDAAAAAEAGRQQPGEAHPPEPPASGAVSGRGAAAGGASLQQEQAAQEPLAAEGMGGGLQAVALAVSPDDRLAILAALPDSDGAEPRWQEVRKPGKAAAAAAAVVTVAAAGKPPLAGRGGKAGGELPQSLLPSSSSVSLDSLGDSTASGASALSFPPSFQGQLLRARAGGEAGPRQSDAVVRPPPRSSGSGGQAAPKAILRPAPGQANLSWAHIVQGKQPPEDGSAEEAAAAAGGGAAAAAAAFPPPDASAAGGGSSAAQPPAAEPAEAAAAGEAAAPAPGAGSGGQAGELRALRAEVGLLRRQLAAAEAGAAQLRAALAAAQEEHRLLLQQAVEETARNVLRQEQARSARQIEALQLLVLQSQAALRSQAGLLLSSQAAAAQQAQAQQAHAHAHQGSPSLPLPVPGGRQAQQQQQPRQQAAALRGAPGSPGCGGLGSPLLSASPSGSSFLGSPRIAPARPLRAAFDAAAAAAAAAAPGRPGAVRTHPSRDPSERSADGSPLAASNPWANAQPGAAAGLPKRPLLPSLDSIWGPAAAAASPPAGPPRPFQPPPPAARS